ncbi:hypothetical protein [Micromonospora carbonacea]|uniref:hypothetical protein n=1 Tax=Micromonospora carbonacea TaxID=47853 RepID=UPI00371CA2C9
MDRLVLVFGAVFVFSATVAAGSALLGATVGAGVVVGVTASSSDTCLTTVSLPGSALPVSCAPTNTPADAARASPATLIPMVRRFI